MKSEAIAVERVERVEPGHTRRPDPRIPRGMSDQHVA